ncbi:hypothetical protein SAMN05421505_13263, partial [Sinosporangium album]
MGDRERVTLSVADPPPGPTPPCPTPPCPTPPCPTPP